MNDPFGRLLLFMLERRFKQIQRNHGMMRIIGKKFTIWVTERR